MDSNPIILFLKSSLIWQRRMQKWKMKGDDAFIQDWEDTRCFIHSYGYGYIYIKYFMMMWIFFSPMDVEECGGLFETC